MSLNQQNHVFIDPNSCGSGVGYYLQITDHKPKYKPICYSLNATVVLSDCNHKMDWYFGEGDIDKIDAAISMLSEFRKKFIDASKHVTKLNGKK